jgi:hypothetical protein
MEIDYQRWLDGLMFISSMSNFLADLQSTSSYGSFTNQGRLVAHYVYNNFQGSAKTLQWRKLT